MIRALLPLLCTAFLAIPAAAQSPGLTIQNAVTGTGVNCRVVTLTVRYIQGPNTPAPITLSTGNLRVRENQVPIGPSSVTFSPATGLYTVVYTSQANAGTVSTLVERLVAGTAGLVVAESSPPVNVTIACGPALEITSGSFNCATGDVQLGVRLNFASTVSSQNPFQVFELSSAVTVTGFTPPSTPTGIYTLTYRSQRTMDFTVEVRLPGEVPVTATRLISVTCANPVSVTGTYDCQSNQVTLLVSLSPAPPTVLGNGAFAVSDNGGAFVPAVMPQAPSSPGGPYRLIYTVSPRTANFPVTVRVSIGNFQYQQAATIGVQCSATLTVNGSFNCTTRVVTLNVTLSPVPASPLGNTAFTIREGSGAGISPTSAVAGTGGTYTLQYTSSQQANFAVTVQAGSGNLSYSGSGIIAYPCVSDVTFSATRNCANGLVTASVTLSPAPASTPTLQLRENGVLVPAQVQTINPGNYTLTYTTQNQQSFTLELAVTAATGTAAVMRQQTIAACTASGSVNGTATCVTPRTATLIVTVSPAPTVPIGSARVSENGGAVFTVATVSNQGGGVYQINYTTTQTNTYNASVTLIPTNGELPAIGPFSGQVNQNCQLTLSIQEAVPDCTQNRVTVTFVISGAQVTQSAFPSQFIITENGDPIAEANLISSGLVAIEAGTATYRFVFRPRTVTAPQFTLGVRASFGGQNLDDSRQVASCQSPPPVPSCGNAPATATVNQQFSFTPSVSGGLAPFLWRYSPQQSDVAPVVNGSTGLTTVTFTQTGSRRITLEVTDGANRSATTTCTFNVIAGTAPLSVTCGELATRTGTVGQLYQASPTPSGGVGTERTWSLTGGGEIFSINAATGLVSGTPTQANTFNVTVTVRDQATPTPNSASQTCGIVVRAAQPPPPTATCGTITNSSATIGQPYSATPAVNANTGVSPFTWRFSANSNPPAWLSIAPATGNISGTPPANTATGATNVRLEVSDSASPARTSAPITCTFNVQQPAPFSITLILQPATSPSANATVTVTPGSGSPAALRGRLQLTFTPGPNTNLQASETPNPSFVSGLSSDRRLLDFAIPAGSTAAQSFPVQQGTVAGSAEVRIISLVNAATNAPVAIANATVQTFTVAPSRPVIAANSVSLETNAPAGCRVVPGSVYVYVKSAFSTPRQITGGTITFTLAPGRTAEGSLEIDLASTPDFVTQFQSWFGTAQGKQGGSVFGFCLPVTLTNGGIADIQNVTVRLRNNANPGESDPVSWR
ncbi:MAG: putative Ig domain-containing protein [Bryobacterales bacterium]|nr:putative Ig domain-containing protein [Bryobacterales bacterium]